MKRVDDFVDLDDAIVAARGLAMLDVWWNLESVVIPDPFEEFYRLTWDTAHDPATDTPVFGEGGSG